MSDQTNAVIVSIPTKYHHCTYLHFTQYVIQNLFIFLSNILSSKQIIDYAIPSQTFQTIIGSVQLGLIIVFIWQLS